MSTQKDGRRYRILGNISSGAHGLVLRAEREKEDQIYSVGGEQEIGPSRFSSSSSSSNNRKEQERKLVAIKRIFVRQRQTEYVQLIREIKTLQLLAGNEHVRAHVIANVLPIFFN